jgi:hypothetical protein
LRVVSGRPGQLTGLEEASGRSNYFLGTDPARWRTDVKADRRVRHVDVKSVVDLAGDAAAYPTTPGAFQPSE